jgi:uncharacterized membrane protein
VNIQSFLTSEQCQKITDEIAYQETKTSGEIKIHIEKQCLGEALHRAKEVFEMLEMHKTEAHTGILIYISLSDHKIAIYADKGIYSKVDQSIWDHTLNTIVLGLRKKEYESALIEGVKSLGNILNTHFPPSPLNKNELSNDISFGTDL